ncbi:MAG TPA: YfhO family protein, partial [Gemmatimonadaceae bacterium]|nr:YfhO family protein [Gemmatimonadaceae bacterium]
IALLACAGAERFLQRRISRRYLLGWLIAAGVIGLLASVGALSNMAETLVDERQFDRVLANRGALVAGAWRSFLFVALVVSLGFALLRGRVSGRVAAWVLAALVAIDLWTVERLYWTFSPPAKVIYASDPIIEMLRAEPQPFRVMPFNVVPAHGRDVFLTGDGLMTHRIRNVFGYHGNQLGRYNELVGAHVTERAFSPNVLQLTSTKYFLTDIPELPFVANTTLVKGPVQNAVGDTVYLYRLNADNPYSWVTPVAVKAPDDQVLATLLNPRFDIKRAALFDTSANVAVSQDLQTLPAPLAIQTSVRLHEPGRVQIELSAPAPQGSSLVVSENYYPGWNAAVDGKPARIGRADYTLIGVELPQGARRIELNFTSDSYTKGKVITWIAIAVGLLMLGAGVWRDRRRLG